MVTVTKKQMFVMIIMCLCTLIFFFVMPVLTGISVGMQAAGTILWKVCVGFLTGFMSVFLYGLMILPIAYACFVREDVKQEVNRKFARKRREMIHNIAMLDLWSII